MENPFLNTSMINFPEFTAEVFEYVDEDFDFEEEDELELRSKQFDDLDMTIGTSSAINMINKVGIVSERQFDKFRELEETKNARNCEGSVDHKFFSALEEIITPQKQSSNNRVWYSADNDKVILVGNMCTRGIQTDLSVGPKSGITFSASESRILKNDEKKKSKRKKTTEMESEQDSDVVMNIEDTPVRQMPTRSSYGDDGKSFVSSSLDVHVIENFQKIQNSKGNFGGDLNIDDGDSPMQFFTPNNHVRSKKVNRGTPMKTPFFSPILGKKKTDNNIELKDGELIISSDQENVNAEKEEDVVESEDEEEEGESPVKGKKVQGGTKEEIWGKKNRVKIEIEEIGEFTFGNKDDEEDGQVEIGKGNLEFGSLVLKKKESVVLQAKTNEDVGEFSFGDGDLKGNHGKLKIGRKTTSKQFDAGLRRSQFGSPVLRKSRKMKIARKTMSEQFGSTHSREKSKSKSVLSQGDRESDLQDFDSLQLEDVVAESREKDEFAALFEKQEDNFELNLKRRSPYSKGNYSFMKKRYESQLKFFEKHFKF